MTDVLDRPVVVKPTSRPSAPWHLRMAGAAAVLLPTAAIGAHGQLYGRWIVDDAAITFAYARSVATGAGPVLQAGAPPVEGYSNPAWLALLVVGRWLRLFDYGAWFGVPDYVVFPKLLALACCVGVLSSFLAIARVLTPRPALVTAAAGLFLAAVPSFVIWVVSGLENSLLALAVTALAAVMVTAHARGRLLEPLTAVLCGALAALATLTRPDGAIHLAAYPIAVLVLLHRRSLGPALRAVMVFAAITVVPVGIYLWFRWTTFGEVLPNTAIAKSQSIPGLAALDRPVDLISYVGLPAAVLVIALVVAALTRPWGQRTSFALLLIPLALAVLAYVVLQPDWMGQLRFATPVWPLAAIATVVAAVRVFAPMTMRTRAGLLAVGFLATLTAGTGFSSSAQAFRGQPTLWTCAVAGSVGVAVNHAADAAGVSGGTLLVPDIGGAALTSELRVVDMLGLADAPIAQYWRSGDMTGLRDHIFDDVRPTFILTHAPWSGITGLSGDPRLAADYVSVQRDGTGADYLLVRRDIVPTPADVARVSAAVSETVREVLAPRFSGQLASCGDTLPAGLR